MRSSIASAASAASSDLRPREGSAGTVLPPADRTAGASGGVGLFPRVHICRGVNLRYFIRTRAAGLRRWTVLETRFRSSERAIDAMARAVRGKYRMRGEVLLTADYYDPCVVASIRTW